MNLKKNWSLILRPERSDERSSRNVVEEQFEEKQIISDLSIDYAAHTVPTLFREDEVNLNT